MARLAITSGQIKNGTLYEVSGSGSVTYMSVVYTAPSTFTGSTATTFSTTGSPVVNEVTEIKSVEIGVTPPVYYQSSKISFDSIEIGVTPSFFYNVANRSLKPSFAILPNNIDIFAIFIGQSNQQGQGTLAGSPTVGSYGQEYKSATNTLVPVQEPTGENTVNFDAGYGLQSAFVNRYNALSGKNVTIFKTAKGATTAAAWATGLSDASISLINAGVAVIPSYKKILVYYQGESNSNITTTGEKDVFKASVNAVFTKYKAAFGQNLMIYIVKVSSIAVVLPNPDPGTDLVDLALQEIAETTPFCYIAYDTRPLNTSANKVDVAHFNQVTLNVIGSGIADTVYNTLQLIRI